MPTPAKLVAAILFAALSWIVADAIVRTALPEGVRVGHFREMLAFGGLLVGWRAIGRPASGPTGRGTTLSHAVTAGFGAAAILSMLALVIHGFRAKIGESLGLRYDAIGEAASAWMAFVWTDVQTVATPLIAGLMFGGGAVVGLVSGLVGRTWR